MPVQPEEFRSADLPHGWMGSPAEDRRSWLTKKTELAYYNFCADGEFRRSYFLDVLKRRGMAKDSRAYHMARVLAKNPLFLAEPVYMRELADRAESILKKYAVGRLMIAGDNRYLSGDLLEFMICLLRSDSIKTKRQQSFYNAAMTNRFPESSFYAPGAAYNEALPEEERRSHREATETLAILTGLEIDSAKSGVKPDLSQYLGKRTGKRSAGGDGGNSITL